MINKKDFLFNKCSENMHNSLYINSYTLYTYFLVPLFMFESILYFMCLINLSYSRSRQSCTIVLSYNDLLIGTCHRHWTGRSHSQRLGWQLYSVKLYYFDAFSVNYMFKYVMVQKRKYHISASTEGCYWPKALNWNWLAWNMYQCHILITYNNKYYIPIDFLLPIDKSAPVI